MKSWFPASSKLFQFLLIPVLLAFSLGNASPAASKRIYTYANGVQLPIAAQLPIFHVHSLMVTPDVTQTLTQNFSNIYNPDVTLSEDATNGHSRFTLFNVGNNTILEQFGATGGFYAYNPDLAFSAGIGSVPTPPDVQMLACQFLMMHYNDLVPTGNLSIPGLSVQCDHNFGESPLYKVSTEWLTSQSAMLANGPTVPTADIPLRRMVTVPINLNVGGPATAPLLIPLAGPGGHISMIFFNPGTGLNAPDTLDDHTPGLQAVAMPAHGRTFEVNRWVDTVNPEAARAEVLARVMAAFPDATNIHIPDPALEYYVSDASTPQLGLEPDLNFVGVALDTGGHRLTLKDIVLPAVVAGQGGSGPTVEILSPANGSFYFPGVQVALQGTISDGASPYQYDWQLEDGTSLNSGIAAGVGLLPLFTTSLPTLPSKGSPGSLSVRLVVTDADGITRQGEVSFNSPLPLFIPLVSNGSHANGPVAVVAPPAAPAAPNYVHSFGVEYGSDYPPYGPGGSDLGGVPPDANGFSAGLWSLGYTRVFNWYNASAWEKDWRDCSLGGGDCTYGVDRADFVYYSGHGSNGGLSIPSNSHDSSWFDGANARYSTARWVGFSSCLTLRAQWTPAADAPIRRWFNAFQGAHMLLGFNSTMADIAFGGPLVDNMRMPILHIPFVGDYPMPWAQRTIAGAWVQTAFEMNAGKPAYIYAYKTGVDPSQDKLPLVTDAPLPRPYPVEWYFWVWWDE